MIKHIRIQNYKSLGDVSVDLDPVTVLIGRSGTGKSNFVDAIRFLRDYLRVADVITAPDVNWRMIGPATVAAAETTFDIRFEVGGINGEFRYVIGFRWQLPQPNSQSVEIGDESLSLGKDLLFHHRDRKWVLPPRIVPVPDPGQVTLGRISGVTEISIAYIALSQGIGCYDFPGTVLRGIRDPEAAQSLVSSAIASPEIWRGALRRNHSGPLLSGEDYGLADTGHNYLKVISGIENNLQSLHHRLEIQSLLRLINRSVKSLIVKRPDQEQVDVGHQVGDRTVLMSLAQESEGLRRFLAHLLALYQTPSKQLLIFEEPENGIHPGALETLSNQFRLCAQRGRGQVLLTTHSPDLLNYFRPEELRVVEIENGLTQIGPLAPEQLEAVREHLLYPGELLTVDPARLPGGLAEVPEAIAT